VTYVNKQLYFLNSLYHCDSFKPIWMIFRSFLRKLELTLDELGVFGFFIFDQLYLIIFDLGKYKLEIIKIFKVVEFK
jgi:hypothetical protein